jgi:hypothetical protein
MTSRRNIWVTLALTLSVPVVSAANAQGVAAYFESSGSEQRPRSNAGLSIHGRDWLQVRAGVALRGSTSPSNPAQRRPSGETEIVPNLRSTLSLTKNLDIETRVSFAEWNAGTGTTADTRLHYRKTLDAFVDELDGSIRRSHDGLTTQSLRLGFNQRLGDPAALTPFTISGAATFEAVQSPGTAPAEQPAGSRKVGLETRVAGLMSRFLTADHGLTFKAEKTVGVGRESASVLAYDQAWTLRSLTSLGFKVEFPRRTHSPADDFEPSVGFDWRGRF